MNRLAAFTMLQAGLAIASPASAGGSWGRIDGDSAVQADLGVGMKSTHAIAAALFAYRYLQTVGIYASILAPLETQSPYSTPISLGTEIRPLFLPRFLLGKQTNTARASMMIDSLSIRTGVTTEINAPHSSQPGFELGLGIGIPIFNRASGPWVSATSLARFPNLSGHPSGSAEFVWLLAIGWQTTFHAGIVDLRDRR
ncbi:MAG: hypothetical protein FWD57_07985 [Polyangiaceae bacterium]|nr:hypothetical protein [Polyangiaceae bacterium]